MSNIADKFEELGVIPVVVLNDTKDALPLAKALVEGGLPCAEVTFRTEAAEESIRLMHEAYPDMVLAAGTVLTTEQVDRAVAAGASVIVSPGFDPEIVDYCISKNIPVMPGIVTPSELAQAVKRGLTRVKFFPATAAGGIKMIKAMCAAYTNVRIMPTGGINTANLEEFLSCDKIFCCGGSWMVKKDFIANEQFDEIANLAREAVMTMLDFRVVHVGINNDSEEDAEAQVMRLCRLFGFTKDVKSASTFASDGIEVCRKRFPGTHGHIAIGTSNCKRAMYFLSKLGADFDMETAKYKAGKLTSVYFREQIGGFALHLVEK